MELKEYQKESLAKVKTFIEWLKKAKIEADKRNANTESVFDDYFDFPQAAWKKISQDPYLSKKNGINQNLPNFYLKIPTGGGKTLLACHVIDIINRIYLERQTGVVLWIVPTNQIYRQTLNHLKDRNHPYRQVLDIASSGRTMILEKNDRFSPQDVNENLIVLLLMLPSANRLNQEVLKVFKDNGGFTDFFPSEDDFQGNKKLLESIPNLDCFNQNHGIFGQVPKTSLGNTLKMLQPIIILDEGHKAYSQIAQETLRGFNPSIIVALSATPPKGENILVNITGQQLNREEMIKLNLHIISKATTDWRNVLSLTLEKRNYLEEKAKEYQANTGEYIRPISLIQVERTGKDQRKGIFIHSEDVKEFLMVQCGIPEDQIAIKSSSTDDIEGIDLFAEECPIRYIITKQALQEGWDCSFAYILTVLTNPESKLSMTQLVGRILRQPRARKTKIKDLDESYVFCFRPRANDLLQQIKQGFEEEGLGDLSGRVSIETESEVAAGTISYHYRNHLRKFEGKIYLPRFIIQEENHWREINYEMDIEKNISWIDVNFNPLFEKTLASDEVKDQNIVVTLSPQPDELIKPIIMQSQKGHLEADPIFFTRQLLDIIKNPWLAYEFSKKILQGFLSRYSKKDINNNFLFIIQLSRQYLEIERDRLAEIVFKNLIKEKKICFFLLSSPEGCYTLPSKINIQKESKALIHRDHTPLQRSLFEFNPEEYFNEYEKSVALYLDKQEKLLWWFRNLAGQDSYSIQGWKKNKIYPDFITSKKDEQNPEDYKTIYVIETKGEHILGSEDTVYKQNIFELCNQLGEAKSWKDLGQEFSSKRVEFQLIPEGDWESRINRLFSI